MSSTPLEVMKAIVENGGPIDKWVKDEGGDWVKAIILGVKLKNTFPIITNQGDYELASITDPNKTKTRPMTPREFAKFVGENMGKYLYSEPWWVNGEWTMVPQIDPRQEISLWLYAENNEGELVWRELPEVEA